jgi:hypothetical protein
MPQFNRTLDWKPNWDRRSNAFLVSDTDCYDNGSARENILRKKEIWLDQAAEGACTGFGTGHVLAATPKSRLDITNDMARGLYYEARRQDEWFGEDYEGSSVNGVMRAARLLGHISEWRWCKTMAEVRHALSYHGPLVIGVNWYTGMFNPDHRGILSISGVIAGGHALMLAGYKFENGQYWYRLENSWGPGWGDNGGCWISEAHLFRLLGEQGEFACPKKVAA